MSPREIKSSQISSPVPASPNAMLLLLHRLLLLLLSLSLSSSSRARAEISSPDSDARALLSLKDAIDPSGLLLPFSPTSGHCLWPGVSCSADGRVTRLILASLGLAGAFPDAALAHLDRLQVLSLQNNSLAGPLLADGLSNLPALRALFLDRNLFSGPFPDALLSVRGLRVLDLSHNRLAGPLPPALASLGDLVSLRLEDNRFSGSLPAFNQSSLRSFNVSRNDLSGAVPVTNALASFDPSAFADNPALCGALVRKECAPNSFFPAAGSSPTAVGTPSPAKTPAPHGGKLLPGSVSPSRVSHKKAVLAIGFLIGAIALIGIFATSFFVKKKKRLRQQDEAPTLEKNTVTTSVPSGSEINIESYNDEIESVNNEPESAAELAMAISEERVKKLGKNGFLVFCPGEEPLYNLEQLMRASAELLGRGSLGSTYKAVLDNSLVVTVKRLDKKKLGAAAKEGFEQHMDRVGSLRHPNLVPLRGYFRANEERLLVYDYQPNGSLYSLIHGSKSTRAKPLHWTSCLKIADDVVQGLAYIHQASHLVHGNITSSNVLLGSDFEACLTDNCLSFLLQPTDNHNDPGYMAPGTQNTNGQLTPSSDIYAFGVLLLELLTGKPPLQHPVLIASDLPVWVRSVREDGVDDERLLMIINIAAACTHSSPESRPTTWQVAKMIQEVKEAETQDYDIDSGSIS